MLYLSVNSFLISWVTNLSMVLLGTPLWMILGAPHCSTGMQHLVLEQVALHYLEVASSHLRRQCSTTLLTPLDVSRIVMFWRPALAMAVDHEARSGEHIRGGLREEEEQR